MQPLALPQITTPTDAGEASNVGSAQSNKNSLVGFNDLMSAARASADKRRMGEEESAAKRAADQAKTQSDDREAEKSVAALSAAAQFASRNVKLKQHAAEEQKSREAASAKASTAKSRKDEATSAVAQSAVTDEKKPEENNTTASTGADLPPTDTNAVITDPGEPNQLEQTNDADPSVSEELSAISEAAPAERIVPSVSAPLPETKGVDDILTEAALVSANPDVQLQKEYVIKGTEVDLSTTDDEVDASSAPRTQAMLVESKKEIIHPALTPDVETEGDDAPTAMQSNPTPYVMGSPTDHDDEKDNSVATSAASNQTQMQSPDPISVAGLTVTPTPASTAPANLEQDPVLTQSRRQMPDQAFNQNRPGATIQNQTQNSASPSNAQQTLQSDAAPVLVEPPSSGVTDARGVAKFEIDTSTKNPQSFDAATSDLDNSSSNDGDGANQQKQMGPNQPTTAQLLKSITEKDQNVRGQTGKNTVSIQELAKLGVTDAAVSIETGAAPKAASQEQPVLQQPHLASGPQVQAQTTENANSTAASNFERRSIAADIRLRALERMIVTAARAGTEAITLQLYPPGLGQVMIKLVMDGQRLRIMTRAANAEAVDTLRGMEDDIRDALAGNGLSLATFDVTDEKQDGEQDRRQQPAETAVRPTGPKNENFTVDLNA